MRSNLITTLFALMSLVLFSAKAQVNDGTLGFIDVGTIVPTEKGSEAALSVNTGFTAKVHDYARLGLGIGVNSSFKFNATPSVPVFARLYADDFSAKMSPYFMLDAGYIMNIEKFDQGLVFFNPTIGYRYDRLGFGIGYLGSSATTKGAKLMSNISLRLTYSFGYHSTKASRAIGYSFSHPEFSIEAGLIYPIDGKTIDEVYYTPSYGGSSKPDEVYSQKAGLGQTLSLSLLFPLSNKFYLGPSATFNHIRYAYEGGDPKIDAINVPLALRAKFYFRDKDSGGIKPWIRMDIGYAIGALDSESKLYYSPVIGISKGILDFSVGCSSFNAKNYDSSLNANTLRAAIGLTF